MVRLRLFLGAYIPLFVVVAILLVPDLAATVTPRLSKQAPSVEWQAWSGTVIALALAVAASISLWQLIRGAHHTNPTNINVSAVKDEGASAAAYVASYFFPFIGAITGDWRVWLGNALVFALLGLISVRSRFGLLNPTLYLFKFRLAQATVNYVAPMRTEEIVLICRTIPAPGNLTAYRMSGAGGYIVEGDRIK